LDVADPKSIDEFAQSLFEKRQSIDALINNAGTMIDDQNESESILKTTIDTFRQTMDVNVYGPLQLTLKLLPLMHKGSRVVNVSSGMGQLSDMGGGYPAYRVSKTAINALTRIFASELQGAGVKVNSVSPGWVRTRMGGEEAPLTPEQGVKTIVWLATLPEDGPTGGFFDEDQDAMDW
jgi:NAD(P)-dependent dehydrogenase (short-subunit alcohol dehydrogenase family)